MRSEFGWSKAVLIWDGSDLGWFVQNGGHFVQTIPKPNKMAAILFGFGMVHPITIALAMMDHSKTEPSQIRTLKSSDLGWCLVFRIRISSPHCNLDQISQISKSKTLNPYLQCDLNLKINSLFTFVVFDSKDFSTITLFDLLISGVSC